MSLRVLIVDDHPIIREGLRAVLHHEDAIELAEARTHAEAVSMLLAFEPDVVLLDINLPDGNGLETTRHIKAVRPSTAVIILTVYDTEQYLLEAIQAGASGYLMKGAVGDLVVQAIHAAMQGGIVVQQHLLNRITARMTSDPATAAPLTAREQQIVGMLTLGYSNRKMAAELHLAEVTIKKHVQSVMAKLGAADRTQAALTAVRRRLVNG